MVRVYMDRPLSGTLLNLSPDWTVRQLSAAIKPIGSKTWWEAAIVLSRKTACCGRAANVEVELGGLRLRPRDARRAAREALRLLSVTPVKAFTETFREAFEAADTLERWDD